jgi:hypothetical protein
MARALRGIGVLLLCVAGCTAPTQVQWSNHLPLLSGMRNRIETLWNWGWSALTHDRAARIIIESQDDEVKTATDYQQRRYHA